MRSKDQIQLENLYLSIHQKRFLKEGVLSTVGNAVGSAISSVGSAVSTAGHVALNIAGLIPGIGSFFDITNAMWYIAEGDFLGAALSLIACIPGIGPAVEEVGLIGRFMAGAEKTAVSGAGKGMATITKIGNNVSKFQGLIKDNSGLIDKVFDQATKNEDLKPYVDKMRSALNAFLGGSPGSEIGTLSQSQSPTNNSESIPSYNL